MLPTPIHRDLEALCKSYPEPALLLAAIQAATPGEIEAISRLWLTEGIPAVFEKVPLHYEHLRHSVAEDLKISERFISMVGSARLGYSLAPKKFGNVLNPDSDLDLFIVDKKLFDACIDAAQRWRDDVIAGRATYRKIPFDNLKKVVESGYINPKYIPEKDEYQPIPRIRVAVRNAQRKLERLGHHHELSARIYMSWTRAFAKICFDVRDLQKMKPEAPAP